MDRPGHFETRRTLRALEPLVVLMLAWPASF